MGRYSLGGGTLAIDARIVALNPALPTVVGLVEVGTYTFACCDPAAAKLKIKDGAGHVSTVIEELRGELSLVAARELNGVGAVQRRPCDLRFVDSNLDFDESPVDASCAVVNPNVDVRSRIPNFPR